MQPSLTTSFHAITEKAGAASRDLELVAAARAGSSAAFEELQSRYSRCLYWRIQSITRNHEDAEDALQETFLRAYVGLDSFEGRSQFASWITRIAINSALMVLRRRRIRAEVSLAPAPECDGPAPEFEFRDTGLSPEQLYDVRQRSDSALRGISRLNSNLRAPITIWIEEECSLKEVARALDLSLAAVKARVHRARKQLKRAATFRKRVANAGSIARSKHEHAIAGLQNRELPCLSGD